MTSDNVCTHISECDLPATDNDARDLDILHRNVRISSESDPIPDHTGCCIELVLFFSNRYFWRKNVIVRVKRLSLEEIYKKCHDVVMWAFFSVVLVKLVKVPNGKNRNFSSKNNQKWTKNERKKTLYATMILDKNEKMCKNPRKFT